VNTVPAPTPADEATEDVAASVEKSEVSVVEPVRVGEHDATPVETVLFSNRTDQDVFVRAPERVKIAPGTGSQFHAGYHRALHSQAPQLSCEVGEECEIAKAVAPL